MCDVAMRRVCEYAALHTARAACLTNDETFTVRPVRGWRLPALVIAASNSRFIDMQESPVGPRSEHRRLVLFVQYSQ